MNRSVWCLLAVALGAGAAGAEPKVSDFDSRMAIASFAVTNGVKWIDGKDLPLEGRAFSDTERYYDRLPKGVTTNVNEGVRWMRHHTAGMQFRFATDSKKLHFEWVPFVGSLSMDHMPASGVSGIDVYELLDDGKWRYAATGRIHNPTNGSLTVDWTPGRACLVNLPLYNGIRSFRLGVEPEANVVPPPPRKSGVVKPVVFYGTSITHGGCCSRPGLAFPSIVGRRLDVPIVNLGFSGSGRGELEMSDWLAAIDASCYVIDCVWNMDEDLLRERYEKFVRNLRAKRPDVPIVLAEGCDVHCGSPRGALIQRRNAVAREIQRKFVAENWPRLSILPSEGQYADDGEGAVDGCHPNDWGMMHMADAFARAIAKALGLKTP